MRRLLAFSGRLSLERHAINANELIAGMIDRLREVAKAGVAVETSLDRALWWISTDPDELRAVIMSLVANARDALLQGGTLALETANVAMEKSVSSISVRDNGIGMTPEVMAKVFDPYFTTKETGYGVGLGLSEVYGFVKQSNGHIEIDSAPGRGTKVTLYFPRTSAPDVADLPEEPPVSAGIVEKTPEAETARGLAGLQVLVVEDASPVGTLAEDLLDQLGCNMIGLVSSVEKALEMADREKIDLALLDVDLRGEPVYPVAEALQARGIPFVFMSGYGGLDQPWNNRPIIQKPFELAQLQSAMEIALGGAL
jgi:CheY-like chemotaxis protein